MSSRFDRLSTEHTVPLSSEHIQRDNVPQALDLVEGRGRFPSARRRGNGVGDVIRAGLRLSTTMILSEE